MVLEFRAATAAGSRAAVWAARRAAAWPGGIVAALRDALPAGSFLALSHGTADFHPSGTAGEAAASYRSAAVPLVLRTYGQVSAFFEGFDLVEPGLVQAPLWRPDGRAPRPKDLAKIGVYAGVGRRADLKDGARRCPSARSRARSRQAAEISRTGSAAPR